MATANPQSPVQPVISIPALIYNMDVVSLLNRLGRFITEMIRSDSSNLNDMSPSDITRLLSYLKDIDDKVTNINSMQTPDLPKTSHDVQWPVEPLDPVPSINNEDVEDLVRYLMVTHAELANSDSARSAAGLISFDSVRLVAMVTRTRSMLTTFIAPNNPLDMPASSPMDPVTPAGKLGV